MNWSNYTKSRTKTLLDGLAAGKSVQSMLKKCKLSPARAKRLLSSRTFQKMMREYNDMHALQRQLLLQRHAARAAELVAQTMENKRKSQHQLRTARTLIEMAADHEKKEEIKTKDQNTGKDQNAEPKNPNQGTPNEIIISPADIQAICAARESELEAEDQQNFAS